MTKKIKEHLMRRRFHYLLPMLVVAMMTGFYLSFFGGNSALAVSGVTLADTDTTGFGLDGRDFTVTWTPDAEPAGYQSTFIYIVTSTAVLSTTTLNTACNGQPCQPRGMLMAHANASFTLPDMFTTDSAGELFATSKNYVAWVYTSSTVPTIVSSSAVAYLAGNSDNPADTNPPQVKHMSVSAAKASVNALLYASVFDDQTSTSSFGNRATGVEFIELVYGANVLTGRTTSTASFVSTTEALFSFLIPSAAIGAAGNTLQYYIVAMDSAGNTSYICNNFNATSAAACQASPFTINSITIASPISLSGRITSAGASLVTSTVFTAGFAGAAVTSDVNGLYTISNLPPNYSFDILAFKGSYCEQVRTESVTTTSRVGINLDLNFGSCGFFSGGGAGGGAATVVFSGPPNGGQFVMLNQTIRVGLSQPLDATTVNDSDPTNTGSNVYLTTDDGTTKIAGQVVYCANNSAGGVCSGLQAMDNNVILFDPNSDLTANTFYTLVVDSGVKTSGGQSISGNRSGGGHQISFTTTGAMFDVGSEGGSFGTGGQFMPPYVRSTVPAPGMSVAPNAKLIVEFNEAMNSASVNATNFTVFDKTASSNLSLTSVSLDTTESRFVTINPGTLVAGRSYEIRVKGAVANARGMAIGDPTRSAIDVFFAPFSATGSNDVTAPTIYPLLANNSVSTTVNQVFEFGFNEQLLVSTIDTTNITMRRGTTSVSINVDYDPGSNSIYIISDNALVPNTAYSIAFSASVTDLAGNAVVATTYNYTTGMADVIAPEISEARCDDYTCSVFFAENMNHDSQMGSNWATSVINPANWTLEKTTPSSAAVSVSGKPIAYDSTTMSATVEGFTGLSASNGFRITLNAGVTDLSSNVISATKRIANGIVESSASTYGSFGGGGMFGPPIAGGGSAGGVFIPEGFGSFTGEQMMFGQADMAFPFSQTAGQDSNVFQVKFTPGQLLQNKDVVQLTFPSGTTIDNVAPDSFSPFYNDLNSMGGGIITFDTTFDTDGVGVSTTARQVWARIDVSGTLSANDPVTLDLKKIINPAIPKGPETGGYTVGIKVIRAGVTLINKTSMPYYIKQSGTNNIVVSIYAGTATSTPTAGANGNIFMFGGGPAGPMNKSVTLTNGAVTAVDGTASTSIGFFNLSDGCYFFGTDPFTTLGGKDYFGQSTQQPTCVNGGQSTRKDILFSPAGGTASVTTTIAIVGIDFAGADVDVFAGGPGRFVVKTLSNMGDYSVTPTSTSIQLPANGNWFVGLGPAMPKGTSTSKPKSLPGVAPAPIEIVAAGVGTATPSVSLGGTGTPPGTAFSDALDKVTFTFATADKVISGTLTDGTNNLANVEVFVHQGGFGAPTFDTTDSSGVFSLSVSNNGAYEIGAFQDGLPPVFRQIEVRADGVDAGTDADIYFEGKQVTGANPLVLKLKKPAYYISGKVLDNSSNGISYAPVFASNASTGDFVNGMTGSDGSYTIFVDNGTWTVRSELPPSKSDTCGTLTKSVIVASANQTSQNLSPSISTCYTLSGTVSVGGTALSSAPIFIQQWDTTNNKPSSGGFMKGTTTDSSGAYSVKVGNGTYRIGTRHPDYGELSATATVSGANVTNGNVTVATTASVTFAFTGGTASMNAFIGLDDSTDKTKHIGKQQNGLASSVALTVASGATYNYFVDVFGVGKYTGTVVAGATVTIDLSAKSLITISGNIKDSAGTSLSGALVTLSNDTTDVVKTAVTDSSGNYSVDVNAGTYEVGASLSNYVSSQAVQSVTFTASTTNYDFATGEDLSPLVIADKTIDGVIKDSNGSPMTDGYVWASNSTTGVVVKTTIDPDDGSYSLPVTTGTWTVKAAGPMSDETSGGSVVIATADSAGNDITLTANTSKVTESSSGIVSGDSGGTLNDIDDSGIKLTAGEGVLQSSGDVTISVERSYTAPDSENFQALSNATFGITAKGTSTIKDLTGTAEIQIDYSDLVSSIPAGVAESDLQLMYYSSERGDYVPVEGGFTIDAANNTITGLTDHLTDFVITYAPAAVSASVAATTVVSGGTGSGPRPPSVSVVPGKSFVAVLQGTESKTYQLNTPVEVTVGASSHTVTVTSATASKATVKIQSEPITVTLDKEVVKDIDTNADNINDLRVTYEGLVGGLPKLTLVNLADEGELTNVITINAGAYETDSRDVVLKFNVKDAIQMTISNSADFAGLSFEDYKATFNLKLTEGNGTKKVYVKFRSSAGGVLEASDTIVLKGQTTDQMEISAATCSLTPGKSYKLMSKPGVYFITPECTKRPFKNSRIFFTYFDSWKDVVIVDAETLSKIPDDTITFMPWGVKYMLKSGSLIKTITDPRVFLLVGPNAYWVSSETLFNTFGFAWNWIEDVAGSLLDKFTKSSDILNTTDLPENSLIKYDGSNKVYRLEADPNNPGKKLKRWIKDEEVLGKIDFRKDRIITVSSTEVYDTGADVE